MQHLNYNTLDLFSLNTSSTKKPKKQPNPNDLQAVYVLICKDAKRVYVGSGQYKGNKDNIDIRQCNRIAYHKARLSKGNHPNKAMLSDWMLYQDSWVFKIIEVCPASEARQREQLAMMKIKQLNQYQLYNTNNAFKF